jgi:5-formyltetrahydrofolate cyclo-ligase
MDNASAPPADSSKADIIQADSSKDGLRPHFRRLRRQNLPAAAAGILAVARRELPPRLSPEGSSAGGRLGLWWPIGAEPDLRPLATEIDARTPGRLALPAVLPGAGPSPGLQLLYLPWSPGDPLAPDVCGIPAPLPPAPGSDGSPLPLPPSAIALLLVPALAIDHAGIRLGSGGGWYDRLRAQAPWRAVPALAVLPAACTRREPLPRDSWDVPFDGWIDETGLHFIASS